MNVDVPRLAGSVSAAGLLLVAAPYLASVSAAAVATARCWRWGAGSSSPPRTGVIAVGAALAGALCGGVARASLNWWPAYLGFAAAAVVLFVVDVEHHRLPDRVVLPATATEAMLLAGTAAVSGEWSRLGQASLGALALTVGMVVLWLASRGDLGLGDVKLAPLLGLMLAWLSWRHLLVGVICGLGITAVVAVVLLALGRDRRAHMPIGAALLVGAVLTCATPIT